MTTEEIIEGEAVDMTPERAVAVVAPAIHVQSGLAVVANLSDAEFETNLAIIRKSVDRAARLQEALLVIGTDYGSVPGVKRPFLHQPGAEKLEKAYGLATSFLIDRHIGNGETEPDLEIVAHARVHVGDTNGPIIAEGVGEASSWEKKYRYRKGEKLCPDCGQPGVRFVTSRSNYWHPPDANPNGGCNGNFAKDDPRMQQDTGQVENADPWDLANTLVKMACKRAHVAGILRATGTSHLFTQDDDSPAVRRTAPTAAQGAPAAAQAPAAAPRASSAPSAAPGASEELQLVISEPPDVGVRMVKDAKHTPPRWPDVLPKLELVGKIGNRKHTVIVLGPLAYLAAEAGIAIDTPVRIHGGVVEEIVWQEGKPTKKEIWGHEANGWQLTGIEVGDGAGNWRALAPAAPAAEPTPVAGSAAVRKQGEVGTWEAIRARVEDIEYRKHGDVDVVVIRAADLATGELIVAALANDIEEQIGKPGELQAGHVVAMYGEWKSGGRFVIDTIGADAGPPPVEDELDGLAF